MPHSLALYYFFSVDYLIGASGVEIHINNALTSFLTYE